MREIKLRAWNPEWDEMVYSNSETIFDKRVFYPFGFEVGFSHYPTEGWIIMQYTGLKDKNGKEIYEGDIIAGITEGNLGVINVKAVILFEKGKFVDSYYRKPLDTNIFANKTTLEVIGNIHDNPELLEES